MKLREKIRRFLDYPFADEAEYLRKARSWAKEVEKKLDSAQEVKRMQDELDARFEREGYSPEIGRLQHEMDERWKVCCKDLKEAIDHEV